MRNIYLLALTIIASAANAQYCVPLVAPYSPNMPGITSFSLNTILRTSADLESTVNNYVYTGLTTTLVKGQTYTIAINHTIDAQICPDMNLRVWIDYNLDYEFEDANEVALSVDHHLPGVYSASFTVPQSAVTGITRLRATAKMSDLGGHSLPTPCNIPPDPLGYHGEIEDYEVNIVSASGITEQQVVKSLILKRNESGALYAAFDLLNDAIVGLTLYAVNGTMIDNSFNAGMLKSGRHLYTFKSADKADGIYILRMMINDYPLTKKFVIAR